MNYTVLNMLYAFMTGLLCLHIFWFYLMIKGLLKRFTSKDGFRKAVSLTSSVNR